MSLSNRTECVGKTFRIDFFFPLNSLKIAKLLEVDDFLTELLMGKASLMEL
jgi:hypothetical protein